MRDSVKKSHLPKGFLAFCAVHSLRPAFVIGILAIIVLLLASNISGVIIRRNQTKSTVTQFGLRDLGELATQAGYYTTVEVIDDSQTFFNLFNLPLTQTKAIFSYQGTIKAGYDFSEIDVKPNALRQVVTVTFPEAKILSVEIDNDSLEVYDERRSVFTPISVDRYNDAQKQMKERAVETAIANGMLDEARRNAEVIIRAFLSGTYDMNDWTIVFR